MPHNHQIYPHSSPQDIHPHLISYPSSSHFISHQPSFLFFASPAQHKCDFIFVTSAPTRQAAHAISSILQHSTALSTQRHSVKHPFHGVAATKPCTVTYSLATTTSNETAIAHHTSNKIHSSSPLINPVTTPSVHRGTSLPSQDINYLIIYAS